MFTSVRRNWIVREGFQEEPQNLHRAALSLALQRDAAILWWLMSPPPLPDCPVISPLLLCDRSGPSAPGPGPTELTDEGAFAIF